MIGDLHLRTRHSTGIYTPEAALVRAKERGLGFVSPIDRHSLEAGRTMIAIGARLGITVIPGVEIVAEGAEGDPDIRLLGYHFTQSAPHLETLCRRLREDRHRVSLWQIGRLQNAGYAITLEEVRREAQGAMDCPLSDTVTGSGWPSDPLVYPEHIIRALVRKGYGSGVRNETLRGLFTDDGPAARRAPMADPYDALKAIKADGGKTILVCPELGTGPADMIDSLAAAGLDGIETPGGVVTPDERNRIIESAGRAGLFFTGDYDINGTTVAAPGVLEWMTAPADPDIRWAVDLVREAGHMIRTACVEEIDAELKGGDIRDLVTAHDVAVEKFITASIRERYPDHEFITEEHDHPDVSEDASVWIIDPIDGTTNFVSMRDYFAVSVALFKAGRPVFGMVYDVMRDELYLGIAGQGAYLNGRRMSPVWGGTAKDLKKCIVESSLLTTRGLTLDFGASLEALGTGTRAQRAYGSAALGICRVAAETLDIYLSMTLSLWDYAAAAIILTECGGVLCVQKRPEDPPDSATAGSGYLYHTDSRMVLATGHLETLDQFQDRVFPSRTPGTPSLPFHIHTADQAPGAALSPAT